MVHVGLWRACLFLLIWNRQGLGHGPSYYTRRRESEETGVFGSSEASQRRIVVEGSVSPYLLAPEDAEDLEKEQSRIIQAIMDHYDAENVQVLHAERNAANAIFLSVSGISKDAEVYKWVETIPGVVSVSDSVDLTEDSSVVGEDNNGNTHDGIRDLSGETQDIRVIADTYLGAGTVRRDHCLGGQGVRVAVIDSGIDYTHSIFGGEGSTTAFETAAASTRPRADGLFPTLRVVDGHNFVGGAASTDEDTNPLDQVSGHGTGVATAILAMAPDVELIAAKVCNDRGVCPDYAVIAALDYANKKGADVVNSTYKNYVALERYLSGSKLSCPFLCAHSFSWTAICQWILSHACSSD